MKLFLPENYARILPRIYDCVTSGDQWETALDALIEGVGAKSGMVVAYEDQLLPFNLSSCSQHLRSHGPELHYYQQHYFNFEEEVAEVLIRAEAGQIIRDVDVWPDWQRFKTRPDIVWCRENAGIFRKLAIRLNQNKAWFDAIFIQFEASRDDFPANSLKFLSTFVPHLAKTIELNRFFSQLIQRYNAVLSVLDRIRIGIAIVEPRGGVILTNSEAQRILQLRDGIALSRDGKIICGDYRVSCFLQEALCKVSATAVGQENEAERIISVPRRSGRRAFLLEFSPLRDGNAEIERNFAGAMVAIIDPEEPRLFNTSAIGKVFRLSKAEQEVCKYMIEGLMNADISDARGVKPETVKSQIKSIYTKVNARSRTELIRLIISACPPIDIDIDI